MPSESRWGTRANALTALRLLTVPFLAHAIVAGESGLALALFLVAVATDLVDGRVARRYGEVSPLGGFLDHATDAVLVAAGIAAVAWTGEATPWLAPAILLAFAQYTFDSRVPQGRPLRASALGRWNGIAYFVLLGVPVVRDGLSLGWPPVAWTTLLSWVLLTSTVLSMADRLSSHWQKP